MPPALEASGPRRVWRAEADSTAGSESLNAEREAGGRADTRALQTLRWPMLNFLRFPQSLKTFLIPGHAF